MKSPFPRMDPYLEQYWLDVHARLRSTRQTDPDAQLNLQALIEQYYRNGRYDTLDYQDDADPPLECHDAEWADTLLRETRKRK